MSVVSDALAALDEGRALLDDVGLRPFSVVVRVVTWAGTRPGQGTSSSVDTPITVAGGRRPKVRSLKDENVVAGGVMSKGLFEISNITPEYSGGGVAPSTLDPAATSSPTQVFYVLTGPGLPEGGMLCQKVADGFDRVFGYSVTVEALGKEADT